MPNSPVICQDHARCQGYDEQPNRQTPALELDTRRSSPRKGSVIKRRLKC